MPSKASKLLEQMRRTKAKWKIDDLKALYEGYGFIIDKSADAHDKVFHPDFPQLVTRLPRHKKVPVYLVRLAVRTVDRLIALQKETGGIDDE